MNRPLNILVGCEYSGKVRDALIARGHYALSCDLLPTDREGPHYQGDIADLLIPGMQWDMLIAFPPCTYLARSGAHLLKNNPVRQQHKVEALDFVRMLMDLPIPQIAIENPIGAISSHIRKPDQIIQPWMFGHGETKATCLWLKNLPKLLPTNIVDGREHRIIALGPSKNRQKLRSETFSGIALAMAEQWTPDLSMVKAIS